MVNTMSTVKVVQAPTGGTLRERLERARAAREGRQVAPELQAAPAVEQQRSSGVVYLDVDNLPADVRARQRQHAAAEDAFWAGVR